jgi:hypothetical protein
LAGALTSFVPAINDFLYLPATILKDKCHRALIYPVATITLYFHSFVGHVFQISAFGVQGSPDSRQQTAKRLIQISN